MMTSRSNAFGRDSGRGAAHPILRPNRRIPGLPLACRLALAFAFLTVAALADGAGAGASEKSLAVLALKDQQ